MFLAADKLRKNLEPSDYKHVALGLIFLKYISIAFEAKRAALLAEDPAAAEDHLRHPRPSALGYRQSDRAGDQQGRERTGIKLCRHQGSRSRRRPST